MATDSSLPQYRRLHIRQCLQHSGGSLTFYFVNPTLLASTLIESIKFYLSCFHSFAGSTNPSTSQFSYAFHTSRFCLHKRKTTLERRHKRLPRHWELSQSPTTIISISSVELSLLCGPLLIFCLIIVHCLMHAGFVFEILRIKMYCLNIIF